MYFPYLRGRQYELLALKELVENSKIGEKVIPVIEPVKLSPTLISTMGTFATANHKVAVIRNPSVGGFDFDYRNAKPGTKEESYRDRFDAAFDHETVIKSIIINK